jgi:hypothetical protein
MRRLLLGTGLILILAFMGCASPTPTVIPPPTVKPTATVAPTQTPFPYDDPDLIDLKELLKEAVETQDRRKLQNTVSYSKWVGAIYRKGGTPPIDPPRGLTLTLNFLKENPLTMDLERMTYEPVWSVPGGDTSVLALVTPETEDPYYSHFYIQREPSAWRFTGIMTRIPYYDAPSVAQLRADPAKFAGKEFMYVGTFLPKANPPANAGSAPENAAFVLNTFSGPLWVALSQASYVLPLPEDADARAGEVVRIFGTVKTESDAPYLEIDSFQFVQPGSWASTGGEIEAVDASTRRVTLKPSGDGASVLRITSTSFVSMPDGTRGTLDALKAGQTVHATGVPQKDGSLVVEELFIAK